MDDDFQKKRMKEQGVAETPTKGSAINRQLRKFSGEEQANV
jgi:hypothetical protein